MNVMLVRPPFARVLASDVYLTYPLGLMQVAATLKRAGHEVVIYHDDVSSLTPIPSGGAKLGRDVMLSFPDIDYMSPFANALSMFNPDVVGFGATTADIMHAREMADLCKDREIRTVVGGVHASLVPQLEKPIFDAVYVGEGDCENVLDVFEDDQILYGSGIVEDGNDIPIADRDCVINGDGYSDFLRGMIQTQRGCPYSCAFCAAPEVFGRKVRTRDPGMVREEVESLGVGHGRIIDDSFGVDRKHALAVCRELEKLDYMWVCDMAAKDVDPALLERMAEANCYQINVGVESAIERWRALSGKNATPETVKGAVDLCNRVGMGIVLYFMIGWPGETLDELNATIRVARMLKGRGAKPHISIVTPYPGTTLWDMVNMDEMVDWASFNHQSSFMGFADVPRDAWLQIIEEANDINE